MGGMQYLVKRVKTKVRTEVKTENQTGSEHENSRKERSVDKMKLKMNAKTSGDENKADHTLGRGKRKSDSNVLSEIDQKLNHKKGECTEIENWKYSTQISIYYEYEKTSFLCRNREDSSARFIFKQMERHGKNW